MNSSVTGMYAYVDIPLNHRENVIALPIQVVDISKEPSIWLVNKENRIEKRLVKVGLKTEEMIEITEGVQEGDTVLFGNLQSITPGLKVKPKIMDNPQISTKT